MKNVFSLFLFLSLISCKGQVSTSASKISSAEFEKAIQAAGTQVLDVRTAGEFQRGHIKNAQHADWINRAQFEERVQHMDKSKPVYIYCLVGSRSSKAAAWMSDNGFTNVIELQGGINSWKMNNKPVQGASNEPQLSKEQFLASIPEDKTTLVDFGAKWCPPCVKMEPRIDEIKNDKALDFTLVKIDGGVHTTLMAEMNLEPIPVFIIYKKGKEVWRKQGVIPKEELIAQLK